MLTEERWNAITEAVEKERVIEVAELEKRLGVSASTIRRDLTQLDKLGRLKKVHGGATAVNMSPFVTEELTMDEKYSLFAEEKVNIGKYAASLIRTGDFVYVDAGTTTEKMVDAIGNVRATFFTNSLMHARKLAHKGLRVYLPAGELKASTEAIVGASVVDGLRKLHFTIGFWGTNGVGKETGFTTPDPTEALVKETAMQQTAKRYVLCDSSKFSADAPVTFAQFGSATVITGKDVGKLWEKEHTVITV